MVAWVVDAVAEREGYQPSAICVTTPGHLGRVPLRAGRAALAREVSATSSSITEPEAAARHYETTSPLEPRPGDRRVRPRRRHVRRRASCARRRTASVRSSASRSASPTSAARTSTTSSFATSSPPPDSRRPTSPRDPAARVALASLRRECVEAKEALSFDSEAVVPVLVGQTQHHRAPHAVRVRGDDRGRRRPHHRRPRRRRSTPPAWSRPTSRRSCSPAAPRASPASRSCSRSGSTGRSPSTPTPRRSSPSALRVNSEIDGMPRARRGDFGRVRRRCRGVSSRTTASAATAAPASAPRPRPAQDAAKRRWFGRVPVAAAIAGGAIVLAGGIVFATASELGSGALSDAAARRRADHRLARTLPRRLRALGRRRPRRAQPLRPAAPRRPAGRLPSLAEGSDHPLEEAEQRQGDDAHRDRCQDRGSAAVEDPATRMLRGRRRARPPIEPARRSRTVEPAERSHAERPHTERPARRPHAQRPARRPDTERPARRPDTERPARRPDTERPARDPTPQRPARRPDTQLTRPADPTPSDPPADPRPATHRRRSPSRRRDAHRRPTRRPLMRIETKAPAP